MVFIHDCADFMFVSRVQIYIYICVCERKTRFFTHITKAGITTRPSIADLSLKVSRSFDS